MGANLAKRQDYTTPEMWRKKGITYENGVLEVEFQSVLHFLFKRRKLEDVRYPDIEPIQLYWAGDRLYRAFVRSGLGERHGTMFSDCRGKDLAADLNQEANELIFREALIAIDPFERQVVRRVCCYSEYPAIEQIILLRRGLRDLITFWDKFDKEKKHVD